MKHCLENIESITQDNNYSCVAALFPNERIAKIKCISTDVALYEYLHKEKTWTTSDRRGCLLLIYHGGYQVSLVFLNRSSVSYHSTIIIEIKTKSSIGENIFDTHVSNHQSVMMRLKHSQSIILFQFASVTDSSTFLSSLKHL